MLHTFGVKVESTISESQPVEGKFTTLASTHSVTHMAGRKPRAEATSPQRTLALTTAPKKQSNSLQKLSYTAVRNPMHTHMYMYTDREREREREKERERERERVRKNIITCNYLHIAHAHVCVYKNI